MSAPALAGPERAGSLSRNRRLIEAPIFAFYRPARGGISDFDVMKLQQVVDDRAGYSRKVGIVSSSYSGFKQNVLH